MKLRFLRPARRELAEAVHYYNLQQAGLGNAFRNEAWATLQRIREFPLAWQTLGGAIRRCQMQRFPYGVIYEPAVDEIIVVASPRSAHSASRRRSVRRVCCYMTRDATRRETG